MAVEAAAIAQTVDWPPASVRSVASLDGWLSARPVFAPPRTPDLTPAIGELLARVLRNGERIASTRDEPPYPTH